MIKLNFDAAAEAKLEAVGFTIADKGDDWVDLVAPDSKAPVRLPITAGKLFLVTQRSALHRQIADALGAAGYDAPPVQA